MSDATVIEERPDEPRNVPPENISSDTPTDTPAPVDDLEKVLSEFDDATRQPEQTLDQQIEQILGTPQPDPLAQYANEQYENRATELGQQNAQLQAQIQRQIDERDFNKMASDLQSQLPEWVDPGHGRTAMLAAAMENPNLQLAFQNRGIDKVAVDAELRRVEGVMQQMQRNPNGYNPNQAAQLVAYANRLGFALNSETILRRARNEIIKGAWANKPIDPDATFDRNMVAAAIKEGGAGRAAPPQPQVKLGQLTSQEYRNYVRENFGFDSGI
jgi:hypothetical protein